MKRLTIGLAALLLAGCLQGCTIDLANQGEVGFRYGTEITFFHRAAKTSDEHAVSVLNADSIIERIWPLEGPPAEGQVTVTGEATVVEKGGP